MQSSLNLNKSYQNDYCICHLTQKLSSVKVEPHPTFRKRIKYGKIFVPQGRGIIPEGHLVVQKNVLQADIPPVCPLIFYASKN
jgi:hypothetical protein